MKTEITAIIAQVRAEAWMIRPEYLQAHVAALASMPENALDVSFEDFFQIRPTATIGDDEVADVWVQGPLVRSAPAIYEKLGFVTKYSTIQTEMRGAVAAGAKSIVLHVDSPGGTVSGCVEAAKTIASSPVPIIAHCSGLACSAAYMLVSGATAIVADESAQVGNIGTILSWADDTGFWQKLGIEWKAMTNEGADYKSTFHVEPNTEQLAFLQESINEMGEMFQEHVKEGRGNAGAELDPEIWKAGWYSGKKAAEMGLIDYVGDKTLARSLATSAISG